MSSTVDIAVAGEINVDLILKGDVEPAFGQVEKLVEDATLTIGSSSVIFACGAARLGLKVAFFGKVGGDLFGSFMLDEMRQRGIDTRGVVVDPAIKTGLSLILSRGNDRAILTYPGSIAALRYAEIDLNLLGQARHLHLGSYFLLDALKPDIPSLFQAARERGLTTSLDTNYDPSERWNGGLQQVLPHVDVLLPNETELLAITRQRDLMSALDGLEPSVPLVAVKLGPRGAIARHASASPGSSSTTHAPSPTVTVVDTTGAGDTFDAGFIYGYLAGWELGKTLHLACACGSLSTRLAGGTAAQPTLEEALALL